MISQQQCNVQSPKWWFVLYMVWRTLLLLLAYQFCLALPGSCLAMFSYLYFGLCTSKPACSEREKGKGREKWGAMSNISEGESSVTPSLLQLSLVWLSPLHPSFSWPSSRRWSEGLMPATFAPWLILLFPICKLGRYISRFGEWNAYWPIRTEVSYCCPFST